MKILVTGATGFTGKRVRDVLKKQGMAFCCLVRDKNMQTQLEAEGLETCFGDVTDEASFLNALKGCEGLIHIVSLGFGSAPSVVKIVERSGVRRVLFVSTTAIFTQLNAASKRVRLSAEASIENSNLDWTILRPTMIYGDRDDRNIFRLLSALKKYPVFFVPGPGTALQQPVHVDDLAVAIVAAFQSEKTCRKAYNVSGLEALSFNHMIEETLGFLNVKRYVIHVPWQPIAFFCRVGEKIQSKPFLKEEQILRLLEDKRFPHQEAGVDFSYAPRSFKEGLKSYGPYFY